MNQPAKVRKDHPMERSSTHRVLVVGLGSMGKRRLRLLRDLLPDALLAGADAREDRRSDVQEKHDIPTYDSSDAALQDFRPSVVIACTSPLCHGGIVLRALGEGCHTFSELNLDQSDYVAILSTAQEHNRIAFLSSTMLYRDEIEYIAGKIPDPEKTAYTYHVGQYLPDWHPWENYKDFFVGDKRTNGCREIFAIQLPWLVSSFGKIVKAEAVPMKQTSLKIDYPDSFFVTLYHEGGTVGQFDVNVVSRKAVTDLEVIGENLYLKWNGTPKGLSVYDYDKKEDRAIDTYESVTKDSRYAENIIENAYVDELSAFFDALKGKAVRRHSFENDAEILKIIDGIEGIE